jgi:hypothetical protein
MKTWHWIVLGVVVLLLVQRGVISLGGGMARAAATPARPAPQPSQPSTIDRIGSGLGKIFDEAGPAIGKFVGGLFGGGSGGGSSSAASSDDSLLDPEFV